MNRLYITISLLFFIVFARAEDGSRLWLRMQANEKPADVKLSLSFGGCGTVEPSPVVETAIDELRKYWHGAPVKLELNIDQRRKVDDGFTLSRNEDGSLLLKAHGCDLGLLYGAFYLLRLQESGRAIEPVSESPFFLRRILNHWDNLDGSIERGYAGESIFWGLPPNPSPKGEGSDIAPINKALIEKYARANASIGINGTVVNNVNASPRMLTHPYLNKVKEVADILRPWGIRVYLSVNFGSPKALGELPTADPLDKRVRRWWERKSKEIYGLIPDFGGFLVKANSEGQPGPFDYGRSHADGANMLADAVKPYGGIVMWRSFVYGAKHKGEDRVKQAVSEFADLDGQFRDNVILQSKNGPLDFQPREPYAPIFDQMHHTSQMAELQITQEYLGQSTHLVYLAPMWKEFFSFVSPEQLVGIAGVANIGNDRNWCGHHFAQANWYAFGRLAWNPTLSSEEIANEWLRLTFNDNPTFVATMSRIMLESREACVNYMMPLGLHHIFKFDHHYGPEPDGFKAEYPLEWCPVYYHKATADSIGFNRTTTGSGAVSQYRSSICQLYNDINTCPDELLLWFHRVPWNHKMHSGNTLWQELQYRYNLGVNTIEATCNTWHNRMQPFVDPQRWKEVDDRLQEQLLNAREWRDVCLDYFGKTCCHPAEPMR